MSNSKTKISAPKGRPMLNWVGKQPLDYIKSFPAQLVETFNPLCHSERSEESLSNLSFKSLEHNWQNLLFHGDNKEILGSLLNNGFRGKIDLIYIDPPFDSGADYIRKIELRGVKDKTKIEGEDYNYLEQTQYFDIWNQDGYLQFMYERLQLLSELLNQNGSIYLHNDWHKDHLLRCVLDEVFGSDYFRNEIIWYYEDKFATGGKALDKNHDIIWHYSKGDKFTGNQVRIDKPEKTKRALRKKVDGKTLNVLDENGSKIYVEYSDKIIDDVWQIGRTISKDEYVDYPTQKKEDLITRLLEYGSNPNDIVLDCFIGSGTTAAVAQKLGRKWIGCDINKGAIQTTSKRLQKIITEQIEEEKKKHPELFKETSPLERGKKGVCMSFSHFKVNDYDLQLLRTEAIELAVQHLGIQRSKTETLFDGTLGKTLVKLIDFNHPLTLLDLQQIQDELKKRPKEQRDIIVVCLGRELTTEPWVEEYNKKHPVNKLQIIELRTDSKYGKFLIHQPAVANIEVTRIPKEKKAKIEIKDFISPTILERLNLDENLFKVRIPDFRSMIDVVLIDNNYNGLVFNIVYSDVPEKKNDLINGTYEIDLTSKDSKVAVKIIDMLGEEVLLVK